MIAEYERKLSENKMTDRDKSRRIDQLQQKVLLMGKTQLGGDVPEADLKPDDEFINNIMRGEEDEDEIVKQRLLQ